MCTSFKVKRAKVKVYYAETQSVSYLPNGKACELQHWYADGACDINCHTANYTGLWSSVLARRRGHTVSAAPGGHATCCFPFCCTCCRWRIKIYKNSAKLEAGHSIECITHAGHSIAFLHFMTLWPWPLTFWPQNHTTCRIQVKFDYVKFERFWIIRFLSYRADSHTDRQTPLNALLPRLSSTWVKSL